jgi:hypothetical protein
MQRDKKPWQRVLLWSIPLLVSYRDFEACCRVAEGGGICSVTRKDAEAEKRGGRLSGIAGVFTGRGCALINFTEVSSEYRFVAYNTVFKLFLSLL